MEKRQKNCWFLFGLLLLFACLCCSGCDDKNETATPSISTADDTVYIVSIFDWEDKTSGAVTADGKLVLPFSSKQLEIISDDKTKTQLWLQTKRLLLVDETRTEEELLEDYYNGLYTNNHWNYFYNQYQLYDLDGNLLQESEQRAVKTVYGDFILYTDGKLESRQTGTVYFDDVYDFYHADSYFVMNCSDGTRLRITDENLQVLQELAGDGQVEGSYILLRQNGYIGLFSLDGQEILPCQYDMIQISDDGTWCLVTKYEERSSIIDLTDNSLRYTVAAKDGALYYADDELVLVRDEQDKTCRMYNYAGVALSAVYDNIYSALDPGLPAGEQEPFFIARTSDGKQLLLNRQGKAVYEGDTNQWLSLVSADRLVVNDNDAANLQDLQGAVKNKKPYEGIYEEYAVSDSDGIAQRLPLVAGYYTYGNMQLYDLLDLDGNILIEQAKDIRALAPNRFWVKKGFSYGLMDETGRWLYQQSLFDSAVDE